MAYFFYGLRQHFIVFEGETAQYFRCREGRGGEETEAGFECQIVGHYQHRGKRFGVSHLLMVMMGAYRLADLVLDIPRLQDFGAD